MTVPHVRRPSHRWDTAANQCLNGFSCRDLRLHVSVVRSSQASLHSLPEVMRTHAPTHRGFNLGDIERFPTARVLPQYRHAKRHTPMPCGSDWGRQPHPSCGAVGGVGGCGTWLVAVGLGSCGGDSTRVGAQGHVSGGRDTPVLGTSARVGLQQPVTSSLTGVSRRTRMGQRPGHGRQKPKKSVVYAGPTTCLRCDRVFESWDRRQNRLCEACRQAIAERPPGELPHSIQKPRRQPRGADKQ